MIRRIAAAALLAGFCLFGRTARGGVYPTIPFTGVLTTSSGAPVTGTRTLTFRLWLDPVAGGTPVWQETKTVPVTNGLFSVQLGDANTLSNLPLWLWYPLWIDVQDSTESAPMAPRQQLGAAPYALFAYDFKLPFAGGGTSDGPSSLFFVENKGSGWTIYGGSHYTGMGGIGVYGDALGTPPAAGVEGFAPKSNGVVGITYATGVQVAGVYGQASDASTFGVWGDNISSGTGGVGVYGTTSASDGNGVVGVAANGKNWGTLGTAAIGAFGQDQSSGIPNSAGVEGRSDNGYGVYGLGGAGGVYGYADPGGYGVKGETTSATGEAGRFINSGGGISLHATGSGATRDNATLRVENSNSTHGMAAYVTNASDYATAHFYNGGTGETLFIQGGSGAATGNLIVGVNQGFAGVFRVTKAGEVYAAGAFHPGGADFAEMLPAVSGLAPGDVLAIGADGKLTKSTEAYQGSVAGVYATKPGVVAGEDPGSGRVPLAVVGVVPVKVTAEGGAIAPGDLLTTSSSPGCAMKGSDRSRLLGAVLGKALEGFSGPGEGTISALVNLK